MSSRRGTKSTGLHVAALCRLTWQLTLLNQRDTNGGRRNVVTEMEDGGGEEADQMRWNDG